MSFSFSLPVSQILSTLLITLLPSTLVHAEKPNVLLICIDDLRPELHCYGVDYIQSPNIDQLAAEGRAFTQHFVQAPTCGASRYALLTGRYGSGGNGALFERAGRIKKDPESVPTSMPAYFREHGYTTVSVGKVSHHPGGRGGADWDDSEALEMPLSWDRHVLPAGDWQHPHGWMHGLANGEIRKNAEDMDLFQALDGGDEIYPDGIMIDEAVAQLTELAAEDTPFFLAAGILRPHLPFGAPAKYLEPYRDLELPRTPHPTKPEGKTTYHDSGEFMKYNRWDRNPNEDAEFAMEVRRHYAACVTYADASVGRLIAALKESGEYENTIIVVWGDHGWHLGEHAVWGKHTLFEESLRSPLIIRCANTPHSGKQAAGVVETIDIFPTITDLAGLPAPADITHGRSLRPFLENPEEHGRIAIAYGKGARTIRTTDHRLILHRDGHAELYDHKSPTADESENIADAHPDLIQELTATLNSRLSTLPLDE